MYHQIMSGIGYQMTQKINGNGMNVKVNLNQILQGGLAGLVAWLFKTVNDLQQQVAKLEVSVTSTEGRLSDVLDIISGIDDSITDIIWKIGGQWSAVETAIAVDK